MTSEIFSAPFFIATVFSSVAFLISVLLICWTSIRIDRLLDEYELRFIDTFNRRGRR